MKIIENKKDYIDQGLDEIRLLRLLKTNRSPDDHHVLRLTDYFYFKEHLFIGLLWLGVCFVIGLWLVVVGCGSKLLEL